MKPDTLTILSRIVAQSIETKQKMLAECADEIQQVVEAFVTALQGGRKILLCGNGGSAADAQHVAGEFVGRFLSERRPLPVIALTSDSSVITCIGNDYGYDYVFSRQVEALANPGDVVVGITTSGNSANVLQALAAACARGVVTVGFTGGSGGKVKQIADICVCIPSLTTARIQEAHITAWHAICETVDATLFGSQATS